MSHPLVIKTVTSFFSELNKRGINYAVLRKVELVPDNIGNDIDILISEREKSLVLKTIYDCADKFGFQVYKRKDVKGLYAILYKFLEESLIFFRLDFTSSAKNFDALLDARKQNEKEIYYLPPGSFKKKPVNKLKNLLTYPRRFLFPTGKFVVIIGPDGVGKSTTAELVKQILEAFHVPVAHMHLGFRPRILPTRKSLVSLGRNKSSSKEKSKTPGILRFFYHAFDYFLGYFLKIRPFLIKGRIVIGERYYYNYLVDPRSKKELGFPGWLPRVIYAIFIPKPEVFILFSNTPKEIHRRRQEHSVEEINRQLGVYREVGKKTKKFFEIRTDKSVSEVAMEVVERLNI